MTPNRFASAAGCCSRFAARSVALNVRKRGIAHRATATTSTIAFGRRNCAQYDTATACGLGSEGGDARQRPKAELSDAEAVQVIRKQAKQRQDSIESFEKGGRVELADKEKQELAILNAYLPQGMSADELAKVVRETIAELGATSKAQMGAVMKALQAKVGGRADGKTLSAEVARQLSQ